MQYTNSMSLIKPEWAKIADEREDHVTVIENDKEKQISIDSSSFLHLNRYIEFFLYHGL